MQVSRGKVESCPSISSGTVGYSNRKERLNMCVKMLRGRKRWWGETHFSKYRKKLIVRMGD